MWALLVAGSMVFSLMASAQEIQFVDPPVSSLPPSGPASGDLGGAYPNPTVTGTHLVAPLPLNQGGTGTQAATAGGAFNALSPITTMGDTIYGDNGTNGNVRLPGNITAVKQYLSQTGTGTVSAAPAWSAISAADILAGILSSTRGGTGNGFTKFSGPAASEKTYTLNNSNTTIVTTADSAIVTDGMLANNYSGVGACSAGSYVSAVNDNGVPTCSVPPIASGSTAGMPTAEAIAALGDSTNFTGGFSSAANTFKIRNITCSWSTIGADAAANTVTMKIRDTTAGSDFCTCGAPLGPCTATANVPLSCDCNSGATTAGHNYTLQYAAATGCTISNPANNICTIELVTP